MPTTSSFEAPRAVLCTARLAPQDDGGVVVVKFGETTLDHPRHPRAMAKLLSQEVRDTWRKAPRGEPRRMHGPSANRAPTASQRSRRSPPARTAARRRLTGPMSPRGHGRG